VKHRGEETEVISAHERHLNIRLLSCGSIQVSCSRHAGEATPQNENPRFFTAALRAFAFISALVIKFDRVIVLKFDHR